MTKTKFADVIALRILVRMSDDKAYTYTDMVAISDSVSVGCDASVINDGIEIAKRYTQRIDNVGIIRVGTRENDWRDLFSVVALEMKPNQHYTWVALNNLANDLLGVDIDYLCSILVTKKLVKTCNRYINGRYITVYYR